MADNTEQIAAIDEITADGISSVSADGVSIVQDLEFLERKRDMLSRANTDEEVPKRRLMNPIKLSAYTK